jgi:hypothetical protein
MKLPKHVQETVDQYFEDQDLSSLELRRKYLEASNSKYKLFDEDEEEMIEEIYFDQEAA